MQTRRAIASDPLGVLKHKPRCKCLVTGRLHPAGQIPRPPGSAAESAPGREPADSVMSQCGPGAGGGQRQDQTCHADPSLHPNRDSVETNEEAGSDTGFASNFVKGLLDGWPSGALAVVFFVKFMFDGCRLWDNRCIPMAGAVADRQA
jgi:hypothetical protein